MMFVAFKTKNTLILIDIQKHFAPETFSTKDSMKSCSTLKIFVCKIECLQILRTPVYLLVLMF